MSNTNKLPSRMAEWVRHLVLNNWPSKLLSLALAMILWTFLITQDGTLTRRMEFNGVTINVVGTDSIKRNGYIVVSGLDNLPTANLRVDVPQGALKDATDANYNVRIDLSRINKAGEQDVRVATTNSAVYGKVASVYPETVPVVVEEYVTRTRIPAQMKNSGELPEGFGLASSALNPTVVSVSGPRSIVETIDHAEALVDWSMLPAREGSKTTPVKFQLVTIDGQVVENQLLTVTMTDGTPLDSLNATHTLVTKRVMTVNEESLWRGTPAEGYRVLEVITDPAEITVTGMASDLDALSYLYVAQPVDITGMSSTVVEMVSIRKPAEINMIKPTAVTVKVVIGPQMMSRTFEDLPIKVINVQSGLEAHYGTIRGQVTMTGPWETLHSMTRDDVELVCMAGNLTDPGTYPMPVMCRFSTDAGTETVEVSPEVIMVELTRAD